MTNAQLMLLSGIILLAQCLPKWTAGFLGSSYVLISIFMHKGWA